MCYNHPTRPTSNDKGEKYSYLFAKIPKNNAFAKLFINNCKFDVNFKLGRGLTLDGVSEFVYRQIRIFTFDGYLFNLSERVLYKT